LPYLTSRVDAAAMLSNKNYRHDNDGNADVMLTLTFYVFISFFYLTSRDDAKAMLSNKNGRHDNDENADVMLSAKDSSGIREFCWNSDVDVIYSWARLGRATVFVTFIWLFYTLRMRDLQTSRSICNLTRYSTGQTETRRNPYSVCAL
jgi:hypothetical protein